MTKHVLNVRWLIVLFTILFHSLSVKAAEIPADIKGFAQAWVEAVNAHDLERFKKLIHPECLKKITAKNKNFYDDYISQQFGDQVPKNYIVNISAIPTEEQDSGMEGLLNYPLKPTHKIQIDFDIKKHAYDNKVTMIFEVVKEGDRWFYVLAEPTDQALVQFRKESLEAKQIAKSLDSQLLKELEDLIFRKGDKIQASMKLSQARNIPFSLAMKVLKELGLDESFTQEWIAFSNSHDVESFKKLIHPECFKRITPQNQDYYDDWISRTLKYQIPENYIVSISAIPTEEQGVGIQGLLNYPLKPTHKIQIDFDKKKYSSVTMVREVVQEGDRWFFVIAEPTDQMLVKFREKKEIEQKESLEAKQIAKSLDPKLLKELEDLIIQKGDKIHASKKLSEAKNISLSLAMKILKELGLDE